jgi:hypothetical protein
MLKAMTNGSEVPQTQKNLQANQAWRFVNV